MAMNQIQPRTTANKPARLLKRLLLNRWWRRTLLVLLSFWLVLLFWQAPVVPVTKTTQDGLRGIWITNIGAALMYYTTRLDEVVANVAKH